MDCNPPGSFAMGCPRQEYCSRLPFHSPRDLPDPGIELISPALADRLVTSEPPGGVCVCVYVYICIYIYIYIYIFKIYGFMWTSLVVQWIRLYS